MVLYYSHILTTIPIPIVLLALGAINPAETLSLILLLAGGWTFVGAALMLADEIRLKRAYVVTGTLLVLLSGAAYFWA